MKKRILFWASPCLLGLAILWLNYLRSWPDGEAESWLDKRMSSVSRLDVNYGSGWPGSIQKHISISEPNSIRKVITTVRCYGSLTNTTLAKPDDGLLGYNECYSVGFHFFKNSFPQSEWIGIIPSNDRPGTYFVTHSDKTGMISRMGRNDLGTI